MIIECIEKMAVAWFVRAFIEIGIMLLLVSMVVIALLVMFVGTEVKERGKANEVSEVRKERKGENNKHPDNPG